MSDLLEYAGSIVPGKAADADLLGFGNLSSFDRLETPSAEAISKLI
jgi:hypothetical protein